MKFVFYLIILGTFLTESIPNVSNVNTKYHYEKSPRDFIDNNGDMDFLARVLKSTLLIRTPSLDDQYRHLNIKIDNLEITVLINTNTIKQNKKLLAKPKMGRDFTVTGVILIIS
uniref:Uncharacterized protein n=1 Tax=Lepeophtheirus salmonis TaxID=72036 RepID=A0A0K2VFD4_LEPSM